LATGICVRHTIHTGADQPARQPFLGNDLSNQRSQASCDVVGLCGHCKGSVAQHRNNVGAGRRRETGHNRHAAGHTAYYFYVEDGAAAYMRAAEAVATVRGMAGEAFNFSNQQPLSVLGVTRKILEAMGSDLEPDVRDDAPHEILAQSLDATKARKVLGWAPQWDVEQGLTRTVDWYRQHLARSQPLAAAAVSNC
jgi:hypothetical protein